MTSLNLTRVKTLTPEQEEGVKFLLEKPNRILSYQCGLGKTLCSLTAALHMMREDDKLLCVIICPVSANSAFLKELMDCWGIEASIISTECRNVKQDSRFIIFNYSTVMNYDKQVQYLLRNYRTLVILDEAHHLCGKLITDRDLQIAEYTGKKITGSQIATYIKGIRSLMYRVIGLTATPMMNDYTKIWSLLSLMRPSELGSKKDFERKFFTFKTLKYGKIRVPKITGIKNDGELREIIDDICLSRFVEYALEFIYRVVEPTAKEADEYKRVAQGLDEIGVNEGKKMSISKRVSALQSCVDGVGKAVTAKTSKDRLLASVIKEIIDRGEGCCIYAEYDDSLDRYYEFLNYYKKVLGIKNIYEIRGNVSRQERRRVVKVLEDKDVVLLSRAGTESIDLQKVNNLILVNSAWSVVEFQQCIGRICRVNTEHEEQRVYVVEMAGTIDTYKRELLQGHVSVMSKLFGQSDAIAKYAKEVDLKMKNMLRKDLLWGRITGRKKHK